ncbi:MAG: T9SS type A sorting domain-containing protein [bacterium]
MKNLYISAILSLGFCIPASPATAQIPAFPGAEGFGATTPGGRGGTVHKVTNLNDSGLGSLREALEAKGSRIVVFDTGGTIALLNPIVMTNPFVTIAGQTAPGDGIQLRDAPIIIATHDVIIRGMRLRTGDDYSANSLAPESRDALSLGSFTDPDSVYNIIIDHNSIEWSVDEAVGTQEIHDVTFSYNIIGESLYRNEHPKGVHSRGLMISARNPGGTYNVSAHHNLIAHSNRRNPRVDENSAAAIENNLIYNYGALGTHISNIADLYSNSYTPGPSTRPGIYPILAQLGCRRNGCAQPQLFVQGNIGPGRPSDTGDEWRLVGCGEDGRGGSSDPWCTDQKYKSSNPLIPASGVTRDPVSAVFDKVLDNAGARHPALDAVDQRIINDVISGTGTLKDCVVTCDDTDIDAGDWPELSTGTPPADSDNDGMPDEWEVANGLNPNDASDANSDADGDGYTNIEEYINGLIPLPDMATAVEEGEATIPSEFVLHQNYPNPFNPSTTVRFSLPRRERVILKVFDILGREVATLVDEELPSGEHSVVFDAKNLSSGVYFYQLTAGQSSQIRKALLMK